ncbi:hypothetical protein ACU4GD_39900 [Cupriavidus basilensis]
MRVAPPAPNTGTARNGIRAGRRHGTDFLEYPVGSWRRRARGPGSHGQDSARDRGCRCALPAGSDTGLWRPRRRTWPRPGG